MALTCSLLKINPKLDMKIKTMLSEPNNYIYDEKGEENQKQQLKLYIENIKPNDFGKSCDVYVDELRTYWSKDSGNRFIKTTQKIETQLYSTQNLENYLAVFTRRNIVRLFVSSISQILENTEWLMPVYIDINSKEKEIRNKFGEIRRFYTKDMIDDLVKSAIVGGLRLEHSPDYARYTRDYEGVLTAVALVIDSMWVMITSKGTVYSPNKEAEERKHQLIHQIFSDLDKIGALIVKEPLIFEEFSF